MKYEISITAKNGEINFVKSTVLDLSNTFSCLAAMALSGNIPRVGESIFFSRLDYKNWSEDEVNNFMEFNGFSVTEFCQVEAVSYLFLKENTVTLNLIVGP